MKTSTVLKKAKVRLATSFNDSMGWSYYNYICYAIDDCESLKDADLARVKSMIQSRLYPYSTLEDWLSEKHKVNPPAYDSCVAERRIYRDKMQLTRHKWIDSMIAEFVAKGD